jgi:hypothetical protein
MAIDPECGKRFDGLCEMVSRIDVAIRGNGKPGLNTRMDRCERQNATAAKMMWVAITAATVAIFSTIF